VAGAAVGLSVNTDEAGLTATPSRAVAGMDEFQTSPGPDAGGNAAAISLDGVLEIRNSDINAGVAAGHDGAALRLHATTLAGGPPASIPLAGAYFEIRRIGSVG
jgi:hypothetical protein